MKVLCGPVGPVGVLSLFFFFLFKRIFAGAVAGDSENRRGKSKSGRERLKRPQGRRKGKIVARSFCSPPSCRSLYMMDI